MYYSHSRNPDQDSSGAIHSVNESENHKKADLSLNIFKVIDKRFRIC